MKRILSSLIILIATVAFAQVPQGISYQAIALNGSGNPVVNAPVGVRLSVLNTSASGTVVYQETQTKTTNAQGLFNLIIGQGTAVTGTFSTIDWANGSKFLKVEIDTNGGTNYQPVGVTQLYAVPYAMVAASVIPAAGTSLGDQVADSAYSNFAFIDYDSNKAYAFNSTTGLWIQQSFSADASPELTEAQGNFGFIDYYGNKAFVFSSSAGAWLQQTFSADASPEFTVSNANFAFLDYYANKAYVFNQKTATWTNQPFSSDASPEFVSSKGNFGFVDYYANKAYVFNSKTGTWVSQAFSADASPDLTASNGNFVFADYYANKMYVFSSNTGTWIAQTFSADASPDITISPSN